MSLEGYHPESDLRDVETIVIQDKTRNVEYQLHPPTGDVRVVPLSTKILEVVIA